MAVTVLYFAGLRDLTGVAEETLELREGQSVEQVLTRIKERHPRIHFDGVRCALNEEFVELEANMVDGDTLALIPPVSGG